MLRKILPGLAALVLLAGAAGAQTWDATKPATSGLLVSADIRSNWTALAQTIGGVNLVADPTFLIWPDGDAAAPAHYSLSGVGATIARTGTGLGDTVRKVGEFAVKVTSGGGATGVLEQQLLSTAAYTRADYLDGQTVSCGAWLRGVASATAIRLGIYDGVGTTYSSYGGNGSWSWVTATRTIDAGATLLAVRAEATSGTITGYVSGVTCVLGPVPPAYFQPAPVVAREFSTILAGVQTVGTYKFRWPVFRPCLIRDVHLEIVTAPTGANLIVDVNTWDGAAFTSMFTAGARPTIVAATGRGSSRPDSTYARRTTTHMSGTTVPVGSMISVDVDQVGSGVAGSDLVIFVRALEFARPLEQFLSYNDVR